MSTCISQHGEFGSHDLDDEYTCKLCHVLDEEALRAELARVRVEYRPATYFDGEYWQHRCGVVEASDGPGAPPDACEACEMTTPADQWRRLYVRDEAGS